MNLLKYLSKLSDAESQYKKLESNQKQFYSAN